MLLRRTPVPPITYTPQPQRSRLRGVTYQSAFTWWLFVFVPVFDLLFRFGLGAPLNLQVAAAKLLYDAGTGVFVLIALPSFPSKFTKAPGAWWALMVLLAFGGIVGTKALNTDWQESEFFWTTFIMEMKPLAYAAASFIIYLHIGKLDPDLWIRRIRFMAAMMIIAFLLLLPQGLGGGAVLRASAIEEANYDGFILGMGLLLALSSRNKQAPITYGLLLLASLLTLSRTGLMAMSAIGGIILIKERRFGLLILALMVIVPFGIYTYTVRATGVESADQFDRVRMWQSMYLTVSGWDFFEWLVGVMPGVPIRYTDPYIQWFIDTQSVLQQNVRGLHAFNYHGFHIRYLMSWGALGVGLSLIAFIRLASTSGLYFLLFLLYAVIQGFSMGIIYLSTVAVPTYLISTALWQLGRPDPDTHHD